MVPLEPSAHEHSTATEHGEVLTELSSGRFVSAAAAPELALGRAETEVQPLLMRDCEHV